MRIDDVHMIRAEVGGRDAVVCLMEQEIPGTIVMLHTLGAGREAVFSPRENAARIIFLCSGEVRAVQYGGVHDVPGMAVYIPLPNEEVRICAAEDSTFIELIRELSADEMAEIDSADLPYCLAYSDAKTYSEDCKSPKTISRMLVPARLIPRFAMGGVETGGDDMVEQHSHPMLEQYFFGLPDNNCDVIIDDICVPFGGNVLLHIPLGSEHGVLSRGTQKVNYLWLDFLLDSRGLEYMDSAHKMNE